MNEEDQQPEETAANVGKLTTEYVEKVLEILNSERNLLNEE